MIKNVLFLAGICAAFISHAAEPKFKVGEFVLLKNTGRPWLYDYRNKFSIGVINQATVIEDERQDYWIISKGGTVFSRVSEKEITQIADAQEKQEIEARWKALYVESAG